jgi:ribosome biogenesis GTPase / thiamine phosphate phosphatase
VSRRGLVVEAYSNRGVARLADGQLRSFHFPRRLARPLPGDRVDLDEKDELLSLESRSSEFGRGDNHGRFRAVAANMDRAVIVIAPEPAPSPDLLHRYLTSARIQGIEPVIVVNKSDLPMPDQPPFDELDDLRQLGYQVIRCRCKPEPQIDDLVVLIDQGVSLLAGQSGVGKTSLLNALVPDLARQTGELSRVTGKGTHTTTSATLHELPSGAWLIDTPGVWEYGLWSMNAETLELGFPEFAEFSAHCRFRDCSHAHEPGCAVRSATEAGQLPASRHAAWLRLLSEQKRIEKAEY